MNEQALLEILRTHYGLENVSVQFLREGGSHTYLVEGETKYFLKVIGAAFAKTSRQSVSVMRYLEAQDFPVPRTILTQSGEALLETSIHGENRLIVMQEYIDGEEPDMETRAAEVGELVGRLHDLLERYPEKLVNHDRLFFIGRYLDFLRQKKYPRLAEYEALGETLWKQVEDQPKGNSHGDLHRGNLLEDANGRIVLLDFDTVCCAPMMFDVMVMCDMTDYFHLKQSDIEITKNVYEQFLSGYCKQRPLSRKEQRSLAAWVAIRHFQLQATILEIHGIDCVGEKFIDAQLDWLKKWIEAAKGCICII